MTVEWNDVNEILPEEDGLYLATIYDDYEARLLVNTARFYRFDDGDKRFVYNCGDEDDYYRDRFSVVYWAKLPEPPNIKYVYLKRPVQ